MSHYSYYPRRSFRDAREAAAALRAEYVPGERYDRWAPEDLAIGDPVEVRIWHGRDWQGYGGTAVMGRGTVLETPNEENGGVHVVDVPGYGEVSVTDVEDLFGRSA